MGRRFWFAEAVARRALLVVAVAVSCGLALAGAGDEPEPVVVGMTTTSSQPAFVGPPAPEPAAAPQPVKWYDSRDVVREAKWSCGVAAADLISTELVLARGGVERNVLVKNRALRLGVSAFGCYWLIRTAQRDPEAGRKWARIGLVARGLALGWNVYQVAK